jgi:hypothetical protein
MPARKRRVRGHIEQLPSGSYRAIVYGGTDPITGKPRQLREVAKTYDAEKALTKLQRQVDEDQHAKSNLTVGQAVAQWLEVAALEETIAELVSEPTLLDWATDSGVRTVPALRAVLMDYGQMTAALALAVDGEPVDLDGLQRAVAEVFDAYQASRYAYVARRAPLVLSDALRAARSPSADDRNRANALLALAYQTAVSVLIKLGETDLAWIAAERGLNVAQLTNNPLVLGSLFRSVAHALHSTGRFQGSVQLVQAAANVLEPRSAAAPMTHCCRSTARSFSPAPLRPPAPTTVTRLPRSRTRPLTVPAGSAATRTRCGPLSGRRTSRSTA